MNLRPFDFVSGNFKFKDKASNDFLGFVNKNLQRISEIMRGWTAIDLEGKTTDQIIKVYEGDLVQITLEANLGITIFKTSVRAGTRGRLEISQDATGGRTLTALTNVVGVTTASMPSGANKKLMLDLQFNGTNWVAMVVASNY